MATSIEALATNRVPVPEVTMNYDENLTSNGSTTSATKKVH